MPVAHSILDTIGNTPLLELRRMPPPGCRVVVKWEAANPSGSVKIRPALHIVDRAEELGLLRPGSTIIESTSGNFGVALAVIGAVRGYRVVIVTDPKLPPQFVAAMRAYGAEMVLVDQPDGYFRSRLAAADRLAREIPGSFRPDQHFSLLNPAAHHASTAPELLDQLDGAKPDYLVVAVSTAVLGLRARGQPALPLRERQPHARLPLPARGQGGGHPRRLGRR
jgi:cystathionine beta-synthase/cysteine synthase A